MALDDDMQPSAHSIGRSIHCPTDDDSSDDGNDSGGGDDDNRIVTIHTIQSNVRGLRIGMQLELWSVGVVACV